jgi:hypothetical protein
MTTPLVSIITPSFNQAAYLELTMRSVFDQDYPCLEYLVVDGGSTDGSIEVIRRYADRLAWWVSEPDNGQAEAINKGLQRAQGEFVAWLNSDDLYLPGAVAQAVAALQADSSLGMVFGDALTIDAWGRPLNRLAFGNWGLTDLMSFRIICQPTVFIRRSTLEVAGFLDPAYHFMLDHHLWVRIASQAPVGYLGSSAKPERKIWAAARHHPMAKNVSQAAGFAHETQRLLEWMKGQPALAELVRRDSRHILAGAERLKARYLLDGGQPAQALRSYVTALRLWPAFAIKHWQRIAYACLCLLGLGKPIDLWRRWSATSQSQKLARALRRNPDLSGWVGLCLNDEKTSQRSAGL